MTKRRDRNPITAALRRLTPSSRDDEMIAAIRAQVDVAVEAAEATRALASGELDGDAGVDRIRELEKAGDAHRGDLVRAMAEALITPIDREDLFRLSRSVDDVLDNLRDFAVACDLFDVRPEPEVAAMLVPLAEGLRDLGRAVDALLDHPDEALQASLRTKKGANAIRWSFHEGLAALFDGELTQATLKNRELLRRTDVAGLRLNEAADALADGALKRTV